MASGEPSWEEAITRAVQGAVRSVINLRDGSTSQSAIQSTQSSSNSTTTTSTSTIDSTSNINTSSPNVSNEVCILLKRSNLYIYIPIDG